MTGPLFAALLLAASSVPKSADDTSILAATLRGQDQALLAAVHSGDRATWLAATTPDFTYVEAGELHRRDAFVTDLEPDGAPPLQIVDFHLERLGDAAIVTHRDLVPEDRLDPRHLARYYLSIEVWLHGADGWKLHMVHIDAVPSDPPAVELTEAQIDALVGVYRGGANTITLRRLGSRLLAMRNSGPESEWMAETPDVLFVPGSPRSRRVIIRDAAGEVTGLAWRDENSNSIWSREH
jgi:hypothetical protein